MASSWISYCPLGGERVSEQRHHPGVLDAVLVLALGEPFAQIAWRRGLLRDRGRAFRALVRIRARSESEQRQDDRGYRHGLLAPRVGAQTVPAPGRAAYGCGSVAHLESKLQPTIRSTSPVSSFTVRIQPIPAA